MMMMKLILNNGIDDDETADGINRRHGDEDEYACLKLTKLTELTLNCSIIVFCFYCNLVI